MRKKTSILFFAVPAGVVFIMAAAGAGTGRGNARQASDPLRVSVFVTAMNVENYTDAQWREAARLMKNLGATGAYLDVYRDGVSPSAEKLRNARDILRAEGLDAWAGITTTSAPGFGVSYGGSLCYKEPATIEAVSERVRVAASLFDRLIVDDFFSTNCKCPECEMEKGPRSWSDYFRDVMVEAGSVAILAPAHAQNPGMKVIIKYPQWYDRFDRFGYDVPRQAPLFDGVWVGTETRDPKKENVMQYQAFVNYRWIRSVAGAKVGGAWFDQINCDPDVYLEQAVQSVLAGAPELILFQYLPEWFTNANAARLRERMPALREMASRLKDIEPGGIAAYKPPYADPMEEHYIFDYMGMLGLPLAPAAELPRDAIAAFLPAHAAADPEIGRKISAIVSRGGTVLMTSGLLYALKDDTGLMALAGYPARGGVKKATLHTTRFSIAGREVRARSQVLLGARLRPDTAETLVTANLAQSETPFLTRHAAPGGGAVLVLNTKTFNYDEQGTDVRPANYGFVMNMPDEAAQILRDETLKPMGIRLSAPPRVALYLYGRNYIALTNFNDGPADIILSLEQGLSGRRVNALRPVLPEAGQAINPASGGFSIKLPARDFVLLEVAASEEKSYFETEPIFDFDESHPENHASTIARMPNGDLLVTWFGGTKEGLPDVALWAARRPEGSKTWSKPERIVDNPGMAEGNSVLFTDSKGKVWLLYVVKFGEGRTDWGKSNLLVQTSGDSGFNWSEPRKVTCSCAIRNNITELPDGRLLLPSSSQLQSSVCISGDGFRTCEEYTAPKTKPGNNQPAVVSLGGGRMVLFARHFGEGGKVWMSISSDWGKTWRKPKKTKFKNPDSGINAIALKSGAIVLAYNDNAWDRTPLSVALSEDGGKTWPYIKILESRFMEFSYPFLIQDSDGIIHLTYTSDGRKFIKHAEFNEAWLKNDKQ